jgi:heat shock protein HslJ
MRYLLSLSIILLISCSSMKKKGKSSAGGSNPLKGTAWTLSRIPDFEPEATRKPVSITFADTTNRAFGNAGCNGYGANYTVKGNTIKLEKILSTKMACMPGMQTENKVMNVLTSVDHYTVSGDKLTLMKGEKVLAEFARDKKEQK